VRDAHRTRLLSEDESARPRLCWRPLSTERQEVSRKEDEVCSPAPILNHVASIRTIWKPRCSFTVAVLGMRFSTHHAYRGMDAGITTSRLAREAFAVSMVPSSGGGRAPTRQHLALPVATPEEFDAAYQRLKDHGIAVTEIIERGYGKTSTSMIQRHSVTNRTKDQTGRE